MSYNPSPSKTDAEKMPKQGTQPQGAQPIGNQSQGNEARTQSGQQPARQGNQPSSIAGNKPQQGNVQGFPQQKTKAGDGPANNPDDSPQPKQNDPTKASNVA